MNKYQEAFKSIKNVVVFNKNYNDYKNDLEYVQELVDKETPMSVTYEAAKREAATCPVCGNVVSDNIPGYKAIPPYCMFCGQKIDW